MKRFVVALATTAALCAHAQEAPFAIAVHGGAGNFRPSDLSAEGAAERRAALAASLEAGRRILAAGGSSVDAVVAAVQVLEDSPHFNAGRGSVLRRDGSIAMDASVMDGRDRRAGAVALVTTVKNPVAAARAVMDRSADVLLAGEDAERFAREQGLALAEPGYFRTPERVDQWQRGRERGRSNSGRDEGKFGTVGAVALDKAGNLAAATSTGGVANKRAGRIGDSPVIGAGTWADNAAVAVSLTGTGEAILRSAAAHDIAALVRHRGYTPQKAADEATAAVKSLGGNAGAVVMDRSGEAAFSFTTSGMYRGHVRGEAEPTVLIFR